MLEFTLKKIRLANYLVAALIIVSALLLARSFMSASFQRSSSVIGQQSIATPAFLSRMDIMQYADILVKNPFGRSMKLIPLAKAESTETTPSFGAISELSLVGTVVGPEALSYAIFQNKGSGTQDVFAQGQQVFDYGTLQEINSASVEIVRNAETFVVEMEPDETGGAPQVSSKKPSRASSSSFARKVGDREYILDSRRVQQSLENPEHILTDARLLPNFVGGKQQGFTISEVIPDGLYHSLGLKDNDILLRVNGLEISNPEVAMQAMTALKGMNRVNLDIIRQGKNMSMSYQMR